PSVGQVSGVWALADLRNDPSAEQLDLGLSSRVARVVQIVVLAMLEAVGEGLQQLAGRDVASREAPEKQRDALTVEGRLPQRVGIVDPQAPRVRRHGQADLPEPIAPVIETKLVEQHEARQ